MINVFIAEANQSFIESEPIERAALTALDICQHESADVSISIENNSDLRELNLQFRQIDQPTDVLSFESGETDPDTGNIYLGDIVISYERANDQARSAGHPVINEIQLLTVHGILHLAGFDHGTEEQKSDMWAVQKRILDQIGCTINQLPEE